MRHIPLILWCAAALGLAACDSSDEQAKAEAAVRWLDDYASRISETSELEVSRIRREDQSDVIDMDVIMTNPRKVRDLRSRSRIQQFKILQLICPPPHEEIWRLLGDDLTLRINISGGAENIASGSCFSRAR